VIAAICCPGQSLMRRWSERTTSHDLVIAVNNAAKLIDSDWVCAADKSWYRGLFGTEIKPPRTGYLVAPDAADDAQAFTASQVITWENVALIHQHAKQGRPINWSVQSALCLAEQLGARHVILYGADGRRSVGPIDAAGYRGEDRTAERWEREERDIAYTVEMLAGLGTTVQRIEP
jgi:hypothetical protein